MLQLFSIVRRSLYRALYPTFSTIAAAERRGGQQSAGERGAGSNRPNFYSPELVPAFEALARDRTACKEATARARAAEATIARLQEEAAEIRVDGGVPWMLAQFEAMPFGCKESFLESAPLKALHHSVAEQQHLARGFVRRCVRPVQSAAAAEIVAMGSLGLKGEAQGGAEVAQLLCPLLAERRELLLPELAAKLEEALQLAECGVVPDMPNFHPVSNTATHEDTQAGEFGQCQ